MSYFWTAYAAPNSSGSVPIVAGGLINTINSGGGSQLVLTTMTTTGTLGGNTQSGINLPQSISNPIADVTNIYVSFRDVYPRDNTSLWTISGLAYSNSSNGDIYNCSGFALTGAGGALLVGGDNSPNHPSVASYSLPGLNPTNYNNFPSYTGNLGFAIFDGTSVWSVLGTSTHIFKIDPSSLAATVYTLPASCGGQQAAFDGRYIYINDGSDIVIWDTVGLSGTTAGVSLAAAGPCYYSANLGVIVIAENTSSSGGNIYTMPSGGGALTLIGNATSITGDLSSEVEVLGFTDGPGSDLWASVTETTGPGTWNIVWRPSTMRTAGVI